MSLSNLSGLSIQSKKQLIAALAEAKTRNIDVAELLDIALKMEWQPRHVFDDATRPVPFHRAQELCFDSQKRIIAMIAGTQGGKTVFGPFWLKQEIERRGSGDYFAVSPSYSLFNLKMLPAIQTVFEEIFGIGRYWSYNKIIEIRAPNGKFLARRASDRMWARIILRSAQSSGGLEAATLKGAWLDECGQDDFTISDWNAVRRRLSIHRGRALLTTTLYNLGWIKQKVIDIVKEDGQETKEIVGDAEIIVTENNQITLVQYDSIINPAYPTDEFLDAQERLDPEEFNMQYRGRVANLRTFIYGLFDPAIHTCDSFEIPKTWARYAGIDFGGTNTASLKAAENPETGVLYFYFEYLAGNKTSEEHAKDIAGDETEPIMCFAGAGSEDQWRREFSRGELSVLKPLISDVNLGISRVYTQFKLRKIIIFKDLTKTIDEIGRYKRKRDDAGDVIDEIENKSKFHLLDCMRYLVASIRDDQFWSQGMG